MTNINWKHLANSPGYKSLKAAYIKDVQGNQRYKHPMRDKAEFLREFNWVINRAKHYSYKQNVSVESILNEWEAKRTYWWLNYYQESKQPKLHSNALFPLGIKGLVKYYKTHKYDPTHIKRRIMQFYGSKKKPNRWSMRRKQYYRNL